MTIDRAVLEALAQLPPDTQLMVSLRAGDVVRALEQRSDGAPDPAAAPATWREKLFTCNAEMRLGVDELAEALGRPRSWIYRHTSAKSGYEQLPHRRFDGALLFLAGEIRTWLEQHEEIIAKPVTAVTPITRPRAR